MKSVALFLTLIMMAGEVLATSFYVNPLHGSDSNSGTDSSQPWKTLTKVNQQTLQPGDMVYLRRGQYHWGMLEITDSGIGPDPGERVQVMPYGAGFDPIIIGAKKILSPLEWIKDDTSIPGKTFYKCNVSPTRTIYAIWNWNDSTVIDLYTYKGAHLNPQQIGEVCTEENDFVYSFGWVWVYTNNKPSNSDNDCIIYGHEYHGIYINKVDYVRIEDIDTYCTSYGGNGTEAGIAVLGEATNYAVGIQLANCESLHNYLTGIRCIFTEDLSITNCKASYNKAAGGIYICSGSIDTVIKKCEISYNGKSISGDRAGIAVGAGPGGNYGHIRPIVENCTVHHNGIWYEGYIDAGIAFWNCQQGVIRYCSSYQNGSPGIMTSGNLELDPTENTLIHNCSIYENGQNPLATKVGGILCYRPANVIANRIYDNNCQTQAGIKFAGLLFETGELNNCPITAKFNEIFNNATNDYEREFHIKSYNEQYIDVDYNIYRNSNSSFNLFYRNGAYMTWGSYHLNSNFEPHSTLYQ